MKKASTGFNQVWIIAVVLGLGLVLAVSKGQAQVLSDKNLDQVSAGSGSANVNQGNVVTADNGGTATVNNTLTLNDNAQNSAQGLFIVNTLGQVGSGANINSAIVPGSATLNSGVFAVNQSVNNFSSNSRSTVSVSGITKDP